MKLLNPDWVAAARQQINACPYFTLQSMALLDLEPGRSRMEIVVARKHLQPFGMVHGGVFSSLVDAASFWACYTDLPPHLGLTTVDLKLNFLAPAKAGRLVGLGRLIKLGKSLGLAEARVESESGQLLAHGLTTMMVLPNLSISGQADWPAKYLD